MVRIVKYSWQVKTHRMAPKPPQKSILKLREKSNPLSLFIRDDIRGRELDSHDVYLAEKALEKALRYKSLLPKGIENLHKIKSSLQKYAVSVIRNQEADEQDRNAAKKAEELIAKIDRFGKGLR